ncbi:MAG: glycine zipper 2TM domain-containing protein [Burkholderiaceae bacterium]|jgi:uncharacterized protein YcfJ|nr:glycine zipper 2TM domain-containing protein [Burkholderiaceae bacterium]
MSLCRPIVLLALSAVAVPALAAEDFARVVASMPVIQAVTVPQQVCTPQQVTTPGSKSGAGAVIGAIAGGALGNQVGKGGGRAVATGVGLVGGALLGNQIEGSSAPQTQTVQQCSTHNVVENRVTGYSVTFEYAGKQYTTQMAQDPGAWIRLALVPVGGSAAQPVSGTPGAVSPSAYR